MLQILIILSVTSGARLGNALIGDLKVPWNPCLFRRQNFWTLKLSDVTVTLVVSYRWAGKQPPEHAWQRFERDQKFSNRWAPPSIGRDLRPAKLHVRWQTPCIFTVKILYALTLMPVKSVPRSSYHALNLSTILPNSTNCSFTTCFSAITELLYQSFLDS